MRKNYFLLLLLCTSAESQAAEPKVGCSIVETAAGNRHTQTQRKIEIPITSKIKDTIIETSVVKGFTLKLFSVWLNKRIEVSLSAKDNQNGVESTALRTFSGSSEQNDGDQIFILSRKNGDSVALICNPLGW